MFGDGLQKPVIIRVLPRVAESAPSMFGPGGIKEYDYDRLVVWAAKGYKGRFEKVPGILKCETDGVGERYLVYVDPRYSLQWVMAEIEATVKTKKPIRGKKKAEGGLVRSPYDFILTTATPSDDDDT